MKETERAEKYYEELETKPEFIKLTHTGISTDYDVIFKFATDFSNQENKELKEEVFRLKMINSPDIDLKDQIQSLNQENKELIEFAIWMTGCGYDFTQHEYFNKMRDKLLLNNKP